VVSIAASYPGDRRISNLGPETGYHIPNVLRDSAKPLLANDGPVISLRVYVTLPSPSWQYFETYHCHFATFHNLT